MINPKQEQKNLRKLPRAERLRSIKDIESLFRQGEAFLVYPIRCVWRWGELSQGGSVDDKGSPGGMCCIMVSVPKRNHKRAVVRNLIKRRMRESYRLNKSPLTELLSGREWPSDQLHLSFGYVAKEVVDYKSIEQSIEKCIEKVSQKISQTSSDPATNCIG